MNMKNQEAIILTSEAPFENAMHPLDKGYYLLGGIGFALGLFGDGLGAAIISLLLGLFLWWVVKANIALAKWKNLRYCEFAVQKQLPFEQLLGRLVAALTPYGIRVDSEGGIPSVPYKNVTVKLVYNQNGTFSLPWSQHAGLLFFDYRYITSYKNTVAIMSILGYHIQKIALGLESVQLNTVDDQSNVNYDNAMAQVKNCPKCGAQNKQKNKFCNKCGMLLEASDLNQKLTSAYIEPESISAKLNQPTSRQSIDCGENIKKIIGKNSSYYLEQFEIINNTGKSKINWASFFLGFLHAAYRNVWKEWMKAVSIPLMIEIAAALLTGVFLKVFPTLAIVTMIVIVGAGIGFLVAQIMFAFHFNIKYKVHVDKKVAQGDLKSDVSVGRAIAGYCIFGIVTTIIGTGLVSVLMLAFSSAAESDDISEYVYESHTSIDDLGIEESEAIASETGLMNVETELSEGLYIYDDGEAIYSTAKILKDEIGMRIDIEAMGYGGHRQGFASGYLNSIRENTYSCIDESDLGTFVLKVVDDGFTVTAHPAKGAENMLPNIEGHYVYDGDVDTDIVNNDAQETMSTSYIILPDSSRRKISDDEIDELTSEQLRMAINEIYARYGRKFKDVEVQAWFDAQSWYLGTVEPEDFNDNALSSLEKSNISLLQQRKDAIEAADNALSGTYIAENPITGVTTTIEIPTEGPMHYKEVEGDSVFEYDFDYGIESNEIYIHDQSGTIYYSGALNIEPDGNLSYVDYAEEGPFRVWFEKQ